MNIEQICRSITQLNRFIGRWVRWLILPIFVLLLVDVLMRYLFRHPTIWSAELAMLLFGLYVVLPGGFLHSLGQHVRVDIFYGKFSARGRAWVDALAGLLGVMLLASILWQGLDMALDAAAIRETSNSMLQAPVWLVKFVIPLGGLLFLLQTIVQLIASLRTLGGKSNDPEVFGK